MPDTVHCQLVCSWLLVVAATCRRAYVMSFLASLSATIVSLYFAVRLPHDK